MSTCLLSIWSFWFTITKKVISYSVLRRTKARYRQQKPVLAFVMWSVMKEILCTNTLVSFVFSLWTVVPNRHYPVANNLKECVESAYCLPQFMKLSRREFAWILDCSRSGFLMQKILEKATIFLILLCMVSLIYIFFYRR